MRTEIQTQRLSLAPLNTEDAVWLQPIMARPEVNAVTLVIPTPYPTGFAQSWVKDAVDAGLKGKMATFSVRLKAPPTYIGTVFLIINREHSHAELGYFFDPKYWNSGYGTESSTAAIRYGFEVLGLERIYAVHFGGNPASGRIMQKIGMHHEGCRRKHIRKGTDLVDIEQYGLLREEWNSMGSST